MRVTYNGVENVALTGLQIVLVSQPGVGRARCGKEKIDPQRDLAL